MLNTRYGIEAPTTIRNLLVAGTTLGILSFWLSTLTPLSYQTLTVTYIFCISLLLLLPALLMLHSSLRGKQLTAKDVVDHLSLQGHEKVLDIGCDKGLLVIEAAKRLVKGSATGIDCWKTTNLPGTICSSTLDNVRVEGVQDRVDIVSGDVTNLPFTDNQFDAAVSSMAVFNISEMLREKTIEEIVRVVKPGGKIVLVDFQHTESYCSFLTALGCSEVQRSSLLYTSFPPVRIVQATK